MWISAKTGFARAPFETGRANSTEFHPLHTAVYCRAKMALAAYSSEYGIAHLSAHQLDLFNKIIAVLTPVEEITKSISAKAASAIIPFIWMLERSFEKHHDDSGFRQ